MLTLKNRLIAFVIIPCWAVFLTIFSESLILWTWPNLDRFPSIIILALTVYIAYPFYNREKYDAIFIKDSNLSFLHKIRRYKSYFIVHSLLWLFVGTASTLASLVHL
jgi:cation transport ATPase